MDTKMKWALGLVVGMASLLGGRQIWMETHSLLNGPMKSESFISAIPERVDEAGEWVSLSYGAHLAPWPVLFRGDPIMTTMGYRKGPPHQFIQKMVQVWSTGNAELEIEGPRTPRKDFSVLDWKNCLGSSFCFSAKKQFIEATMRDLIPYRSMRVDFSWFESDSLQAARGIHLHFDLGTHELDRFVVITPLGGTQNFTLKSAKNEVGSEARSVFRRIIYGMTVKDGAAEAKIWIANRLKSIELAKIEKKQDPKSRYLGLIEVQNLLFCELALDPSAIAPFFHLAGVTHLIGMSLLKEKNVYFKEQESWSISIQPLLSTLIQYVGDFPDHGKKGERGAALANMESLLQDFLLLKQKITQ